MCEDGHLPRLRHKRRATGGKRNVCVKKRKFESAARRATRRSASSARTEIRTRGGNKKFRALRLESGNYSWGSEVCTRKTRILDAVYNSTNNELVRAKTLVKNTIVQVDATPFRQWYEAHYGVEIGRKKKGGGKKKDGDAEADAKKSSHVLRKLAQRQKGRSLESTLDDQFASGRLLAVVSSRPGQSAAATLHPRGPGARLYKRKLDIKKKK
ncbi:hypothetical protein JL720_13164 [Aureococcus anophagefferens]|nr:hypothetical protein JL720_13164 [Aureococcus anophagefferens]